MEIGLHVSSFTWPGGTPALRDNLARIATTAEEQGFAKLSVMDHVWQIFNIGPPEQEMLEATRRSASWRDELNVLSYWRGSPPSSTATPACWSKP
jgi:hypothetical protein